VGVDPAIAEEALILTAIGMGTAFAVLVLLLAVILLIGVINRYFNGNEEQSETLDSDPHTDDEDVDEEARDRALAAALAVTALIASKPKASFNTGEDG
jgi:Na+-transporting methylmalonyl-CoA/oxaloacetate decarboxylase gamma subunit